MTTMESTSDEFSKELDDYLLTQTNTSDNNNNNNNNNNNDWTFDAERNVYVMHESRSVMYFMNDIWIHGDYDAIYSERYVYDAQTDLWFDKETKMYSRYDEELQQYVPPDEYWLGHPQTTLSIRLVVLSSPHFEKNKVVLIDENGITIGRDRSWDRRLRLPEMIVSKYHCTIFLDKEDKLFFIVDVGSQHGTLVNEKRLSESKQSSMPYELRHMDVITIGSTQLQVHLHETGWPCQTCVSDTYIETTQGKKEKKKTTTTTTSSSVVDLEQSRREWLKNAKKLYAETPSKKEQQDEESSEHYIDRADIRRKTTPAEKAPQEHQVYSQLVTTTSAAVAAATTLSSSTTSTSHSFTLDTRSSRSNKYNYNNNDDDSRHDYITTNTPVQGKGQQMLQKLGWQPGQGLGKDQENAIKVPIQPVTQTTKQGLGSHIITTTTTTTTNMPGESKKDRNWRLAQERYSQAQ